MILRTLGMVDEGIRGSQGSGPLSKTALIASNVAGFSGRARKIRQTSSSARRRSIRECRDPKDDEHLALALAGKADVIVSSDVHDLLSMHPYRPVRERHDVPSAGLGMRIRDRPGLCLEVELAPLGERELAPALQRKQEYPKDVGQALEAAGLVEVLKESLELLIG